jgi:hypothetical protein
LAWHPTANNILATAGMIDYFSIFGKNGRILIGGENKILVWNVGTGNLCTFCWL